MKFLSKHILVTSFACLFFSWRVNTSSQSGSEIVKSEPKKGGMQPDEDEMGVGESKLKRTRLQSTHDEMKFIENEVKKVMLQSADDEMDEDFNSIEIIDPEKEFFCFFDARRGRSYKEWSNEEILEVAAMGSQLGMRREIYSHKITITDLLIYAIMNSLITEKDLDCCEFYKKEVLEFIEKQHQLRKTAISESGNLLKLDCSRIYSSQTTYLMKHFFENEKMEDGFEIKTYAIIGHFRELIQHFIESHPVSFFFTNNYAAISSNEKLSIPWEKLDNGWMLHAEFKVKSIPEKLELIPEGTLTEMNIFHPKTIEFLFSNSTHILSRMKKCNQLITKGDLDFDSFGEVFPLFRRIILADLMRSNWKSTNYLNLFTNEKEAQNHTELFGKKDKSKWKLFDFNLKEKSKSIEKLKEECLESNQIVLDIGLDENSKVEYLSDVIENDKIIGIKFNFSSSFCQYEELYEIIKRKAFKVFIFHGPSTTEQNSNFIAKLKQSSYWESVEYLGCWRYSLKTALEILRNLPLKLESVDLLLKTANRELIDKKEIASVKELNVKLHYDGSKQDISDLLSIFPNLEKVTIDSAYTLESFEIKNENLTEIEIRCSRLKNQSDFVQQLARNSKLEYVRIKEERSGLTEWKRNGNQVYFKFDDKSYWNIHHNEWNELISIIDELESLEDFHEFILRVKREPTFLKHRAHEQNRLNIRKRHVEELKNSFYSKYKAELKKLKDAESTHKNEKESILQNIKSCFDLYYKKATSKLEEIEEEINNVY